MASNVVLVVSRESGVRRVIASTLRRTGFAVIEAANDKDALDLTQGSRIGLLVMDAISSETAEGNVVGRLRLGQSDLKVLYLVDHHVARPDVDASYLHKPFFVDELSDAVTSMFFGRCRCPSCLRRSQVLGE